MLLEEIGYELGPLPICSDNQGAIFISSNPVTERRSKHIDIRYHYIRELIEDKKVEVFYISTEENPADLFTVTVHATNSRTPDLMNSGRVTPDYRISVHV